MRHLAIFVLTVCSTVGCKSTESAREPEVANESQAEAPVAVPDRTSNANGKVELVYNARYDAESNELRFEAFFPKDKNAENGNSVFENGRVSVDDEKLDVREDFLQCPEGVCFVLSKRINEDKLKDKYDLVFEHEGSKHKDVVDLPKPVALDIPLSTLVTSRPEPLKITWKPFTPKKDEKLSLVLVSRTKTKTLTISHDVAKKGRLVVVPSELRDFQTGFLTVKFQRQYTKELKDPNVGESTLNVSSLSETKQVYLK